MSLYERVKYRFSCGADFCRWHSRWHTRYADERLCLSRDECDWYLRDADRGGGESGGFKLSCRHGIAEGIGSGDSGWHSLQLKSVSFLVPHFFSSSQSKSTTYLRGLEGSSDSGGGPVVQVSRR